MENQSVLGLCESVERNNETWELDPTLDDGAERTVWMCKKCPEDASCTRNALVNAKPWSFISEEMCRSYVARHLKVSGHHQMDEAAALIGAQYCCITSYQQTMADREAERDNAARAAAGQAAADKAWQDRHAGGGGGGGGRNRSRSPRRPRMPRTPSVHRRPAERASAIGAPLAAAPLASPSPGPGGDVIDVMPRMCSVLETLNDTVHRMAQNQASSGSSSASSALCVSGPIIHVETNVTLPVQHLRLVLSSVRAIRNAAENLTTMIPVLTAAEQALNQHLCN